MGVLRPFGAAFRCATPWLKDSSGASGKRLESPSHQLSRHGASAGVALWRGSSRGGSSHVSCTHPAHPAPVVAHAARAACVREPRVERQWITRGWWWRKRPREWRRSGRRGARACGPRQPQQHLQHWQPCYRRGSSARRDAERCARGDRAGGEARPAELVASSLPPAELFQQSDPILLRRGGALRARVSPEPG